MLYLKLIRNGGLAALQLISNHVQYTCIIPFFVRGVSKNSIKAIILCLKMHLLQVAIQLVGTNA